jgi:CRP-like cAMP-binding protein
MEDVYSADEFTLRMDRAEIAAYLSTSTKTLNRILKQLRQDQFLEFNNKRIKIPDPHLLAKLILT